MTIENLILTREQFPITRTNQGKTYRNNVYNIIPFLHPHFIENGFSLDLVDEQFIKEVESQTSIDEGKKIKLGRIEVGSDYIQFSNHKYILVNGPRDFCIEPDKITPRGGDGGLYIEGKVAEKFGRVGIISDSKGMYKLQPKTRFHEDLLKEYNLEVESHDGVHYATAKRFWNTHNIDDRYIIISNAIISLNNAHVRKIHSKKFAC